MNLRKIKTILLFTSVLLLSCSDYKYEYEKGLRQFFSNELKIDKLNSNYYFLQVNDCNTCMGDYLNLEYLYNHQFKNLSLIIVGNSEKERVNDLIKLLKNKYKIYFSSKKSIYQYPTGIEKTLLVLAKNDKILNVLHIYDPQINELSKYLND